MWRWEIGRPTPGPRAQRVTPSVSRTTLQYKYPNTWASTQTLSDSALCPHMVIGQPSGATTVRPVLHSLLQNTEFILFLTYYKQCIRV